MTNPVIKPIVTYFQLRNQSTSVNSLPTTKQEHFARFDFIIPNSYVAGSGFNVLISGGVQLDDPSAPLPATYSVNVAVSAITVGNSYAGIIDYPKNTYYGGNQSTQIFISQNLPTGPFGNSSSEIQYTGAPTLVGRYGPYSFTPGSNVVQYYGGRQTWTTISNSNTLVFAVPGYNTSSSSNTNASAGATLVDGTVLGDQKLVGQGCILTSNSVGYLYGYPAMYPVGNTLVNGFVSGTKHYSPGDKISVWFSLQNNVTANSLSTSQTLLYGNITKIQIQIANTTIGVSLLHVITGFSFGGAITNQTSGFYANGNSFIGDYPGTYPPFTAENLTGFSNEPSTLWSSSLAGFGGWPFDQNLTSTLPPFNPGYSATDLKLYKYPQSNSVVISAGDTSQFYNGVGFFDFTLPTSYVAGTGITLNFVVGTGIITSSYSQQLVFDYPNYSDTNAYKLNNWVPVVSAGAITANSGSIRTGASFAPMTANYSGWASGTYYPSQWSMTYSPGTTILGFPIVSSTPSSVLYPGGTNSDIVYVKTGATGPNQNVSVTLSGYNKSLTTPHCGYTLIDAGTLGGDSGQGAIAITANTYTYLGSYIRNFPYFNLYDFGEYNGTGPVIHAVANNTVAYQPGDTISIFVSTTYVLGPGGPISGSGYGQPTSFIQSLSVTAGANTTNIPFTSFYTGWNRGIPGGSMHPFTPIKRDSSAAGYNQPGGELLDGFGLRNLYQREPRSPIGPIIPSVIPMTLLRGTNPPTTGRVGSEYIFNSVVYGGSRSYTYSLIGPWPPEITVNNSTGQISGIFANAGTIANVSIQINDTGNNTISYEPFNLVVVPNGSSYSTEAVSFDGTTVLVNNSLTTANSAQLSYSFWANIQGNFDENPWWIVDPVGSYQTYDRPTFGNFGSFSNPNASSADFNTTVSANNIRNFGPVSTGLGWTHILVSMDAVIEKACIIINGTTVINSSNFQFTYVTGGTIAISGLPFFIGGDSFSDNINSYIADFWFDVGVSLLNANGTIDANVIGKFIDTNGFPVDLGSNGSIPTGSSPTIYLHCDTGNAVSTFLTNRGTGGNFTTFSGALQSTGGSTPS